MTRAKKHRRDVRIRKRLRSESRKVSERIESSPEFQALAEKAVMDLMIHGVSVTEFPPDGTEFIVKGLNE